MKLQLLPPFAAAAAVAVVAVAAVPPYSACLRAFNRADTAPQEEKHDVAIVAAVAAAATVAVALRYSACPYICNINDTTTQG